MEERYLIKGVEGICFWLFKEFKFNIKEVNNVIIIVKNSMCEDYVLLIKRGLCL